MLFNFVQNKLEGEWNFFIFIVSVCITCAISVLRILQTTVLLGANVALLSSPIIVSSNDNGTLWMSPAGVTSQVSIIASVTSIIIGLLLVRRNRVGALDSKASAIDVVRSPVLAVSLLGTIISYRLNT